MGSLAVAVVLAAALGACGGAPQKPGERRFPGGPRVDAELDPTDVLPADLDLVVRIDVGRMRAALGPAADELAKRALRGAEEAEVREAIACADVVWIATHALDVAAGDRVIVVEGKSCMPELGAARWERVRSPNGSIRIFDRKSDAPRAGTARIMNLGNRATVFVSPVELDAVKRVLADGPDAKRGNPTAEGVVSVDLRAGRLPPSLEAKYPSIGAVLAGIDRVRGAATLVGDGLKIDAQVLGASPASAQKAARFFEAMRDSLSKSPRFAAAVKDATVEQVEKTVQLKVSVPAKIVLAMMAGPVTMGPQAAPNPGPAEPGHEAEPAK